MTPGRLTELTRLDSGLRVVTERIPGIETAALGVWVGTGARFETPATNGVAHLLEHMVFKGTSRRSAEQIAVEIEDVGGHLNAYTGRETTAFYARVLKEHCGLALDMIADMLQESLFDEGELARERDVVLQEIGMVADTPDDIIFDHFQMAAYPDQAVGRPVLGTAETVGAIPREALLAWRDRHYSPDRAVVIAAGAIEHEAIVALAERLFARLPQAGFAGAPEARYHGGVTLHEQVLEQAHLVLGFRAAGFHDPAYYATNVFATLLGGGMSSRLFQEIRERRGLAYSIHSFAAPLSDDGLFAVYAGTSAERLGELVTVLGDEWLRSVGTVGEAEVARAKAQLKSSLLMSMEGAGGRAEQLGQQILLFDRPLAPDEIIARVEAVDVPAVRDAAEAMIRQPMTLAALGPISGLPDPAGIAARFG